MSKRARILVVEDDLDIRTLIALTLEGEGYEVFLARNGHEGLRVLAEVDPDLVLLDLRMPSLDGRGFGAVVQAAATTERPAVPIVAMSGVQDSSSVCEEIGARAFVAKPFDLGALVALIEQHRRR